MKNIRENYNKEEKQEEDNLFDYKYYQLFKRWKFIIGYYENLENTLLNIKNSIVDLYKTQLLMFFIYSLVS